MTGPTGDGPRFRPRPMPRQLATMLTPVTAAVGRVLLERGVDVRRTRLMDAARDRVQQRRRPSRPRMRALIAAGGGRLRWRDVPAPPPPGPDAAGGAPDRRGHL